MIPTTPNSSFVIPPSRRDTRGQRGATLIVTLGILTVLSVMAVTFLVTARLQRQATASKQSRFVARNYMDAGLYQAIRQIENAFTFPNYTDDTDIPAGAYLTHQRLAPVNHWFSQAYARTNDPDIAFQAADVLASPTRDNAPTVNLLSPSVMRFVPAALTNGLQLDSRRSRPLRSGWIRLFDEDSASEPLLAKPGRVSYLVFNCSGFADANTFAGGPTTQKLQRLCFSQADATNWFERARAIGAEPFASLFAPETGLEEENPFFHLSYDPDPDVYPLHYDCYETCGSIGFNRFGAGPVLNLNMPQAYQAMAALKENATYWKFNLNSLTNSFALGTESTDESAPWFNDAGFRAGWLDPVTFLLEMMRHEEPTTTLHRWPDSSHLAWSIANFMDPDRIPQVSDFPTDEALEPDLASRASYAVEDVPLINKVTVFNIYDQKEDIKAPKEPAYYGLPASGLSNHYAVAVELWYPFAPNLPAPPNGNVACYVGIYTNSADVQTTTNRPWSAAELRDWFNWDNVDNSNSVMHTLFYSWARAYTSEVGPDLAGHPLWQTVTDQAELWFTPSMTNHPSWPVADTNGAFALADTPIWQAFYPDTYAVVSSNETGTVTTNVYTFLNTTNSYTEWISEPDLATNRLVGQIGTTAPEPYPVLLWTNLTTAALVTNVLGAVLTPDDTLIPFYSPGVTNRLVSVAASPEGIGVTVSNELTGAVSTYPAAGLVLSPWADDGTLLFAAQTNLQVTAEIFPVEPLPMPEDLGLALSALFLMLPTNSLADLYVFLQLTPDQFTDDNLWQDLLDTFNQNPSILNRLMPSHQAPTLGAMTPDDRHALWPTERAETVVPDTDASKLAAPTFQGYFWTVYPKKTVTFMEVTATTPVEGQAGAGGPEDQAVTNYHALGAMLDGKINTLWLRPAVTVNPEGAGAAPEEDQTESDIIVDEALLARTGETEASVWGWTSATNLCIPDPRMNAYARDWRPFPDGKRWLDPDVLNTTNLNTGVHELPFIHADAAFASIGDIGHIYASYPGQDETTETETENRRRSYDTLTFSTRAGAALLDIFTLSATNGPRRGLVQANSLRRPVVQALLSDVRIGWTNSAETAAERVRLSSVDDRFEKWADAYADALTNSPYSMGWRSYADMLPNLSTNQALRLSNVWGNKPGLHPMHDYTEDVLRGLVDKVSFRQNIFVIVVAAQALSPASTDRHPIPLAEQRAAVTVIRDAYTGKWLVHSWVWLTE